jgi:hypothetical protein
MLPSLIMDFTDQQLQKCYEKNFAVTGGHPEGQCQVRALIATYDVFQMFEGNHSARVHETMDQLLSLPLRPGLRGWYQRAGAEKDFGAHVLRDRLSQLAGEKLEGSTEISNNPS